MSRRPTKTLLSGLVVATLVLTTAMPAMATGTASGVSKNVKKASHTYTSNITKQPVKNVPRSNPANKMQRKPYIAQKNNRPAFATDRVIVKFKPGTTAQSIMAATAPLNLASTQKLKLTGAQVMTVKNGQPIDKVIAALKKTGVVEYAQPDYKFYPSDVTDPLYSQEWGLKNTGQAIGDWFGTPGIDINVEQAWNAGITGSSDVIVAVVDTGVDINHPDLAPNIWTNPNPDPVLNDVHGYDFYHNDNTVFDAQDGDIHGTHVAGTIAAAADGQGVVGVAPGVKIMPIKFIGPDGGTTEDAIRAIEYAKEHGAKIINASWEGADEDPALRDAIANSGLLFVSAAGNSSLDLDTVTDYPASFKLPNQINVAALNNEGYLADFSNYGANSVDIAAPGVDVLSTVPRTIDTGASLEVTGPNYKAVVQGFGLEAFGTADNAAQRVDIVQHALDSMGITATDPILLVQDDQSDTGYEPDVSDYYNSALAGYSNVTTKKVAAMSAGPTADEMSQYKAVIWYTGSTSGVNGLPNLLGADQDNLQAYLTGGGNLYLSGGDAMYGVDNGPLVRSTLGTVITQDGMDTWQLKGVDDTPYAGTTFNLDNWHEQMLNDSL
ncbi:MAG: S8 family peptidase, partial [Tumebacillaceae bacterium]